jgi:hypothetical protein
MQGLTYPVKKKDHPVYLPLLIRAGGSMKYENGRQLLAVILSYPGKGDG